MMFLKYENHWRIAFAEVVPSGFLLVINTIIKKIKSDVGIPAKVATRFYIKDLYYF